MLFDTAWLFYRSNRKMAKAAKVSDQAVSLWKKKGVIPIDKAVVLELDSKGAITVAKSAYLKVKVNA